MRELFLCCYSRSIFYFNMSVSSLIKGNRSMTVLLEDLGDSDTRRLLARMMSIYCTTEWSITCSSPFEEKILLYDGKKTLAVESSWNQCLLWNLNSMKDYLLCSAEKDGIMRKTKERKAAKSDLWCGATFGESYLISFDTCNEIYGFELFCQTKLRKNCIT